MELEVQNMNRDAKTISIKNAMVIPISIGVYDENPINAEIDFTLKDLLRTWRMGGFK